MPDVDDAEDSHFNSIKVQLERVMTKSMEAILEFQFHKGTIRTNMQTADIRPYDISIP